MLDDKEFQARLNKALGDMRNGAVKGIKLACAHLKLETQKKVPVDEGNLKASAYTSVSTGKNNVVGEIGFTASYAAAVHEKPMVHKGEPRKGANAKGKYWDPQGSGGNKFLQRALDENQHTILTIIQKAAKL